MRTQVSWQVRLAVKPEQLENFRRLTGEMVHSTLGEHGVLGYERFVTPDGAFVHVYERYSDSSAAMEHLREFRKNFGERFSRMVDRKEFTVYGNPSGELREVLDSFGAQYLAPFGDFEYWS